MELKLNHLKQINLKFNYLTLMLFLRNIFLNHYHISYKQINFLIITLLHQHLLLK